MPDDEVSAERSGTPAKSGASTPGAMAARSPFGALRQEMDRVFNSFAAPHVGWGGFSAPAFGAMGLRVDIGETATEIEVKADLPGVSEEDVEVTLDGDILRIEAEKKLDTERKESDWRVLERSCGFLERSIKVPRGIDPDAVEASFDKGVLTIRMPKPPGETDRARRIVVKNE